MSKRKKRKDLSDERLTTVLGFAWYTPDQYERLPEVVSDRDNLESTYEEWKVTAHNVLQALSKPGIVPRKVMVDVGELLRWCKSQNLPVNGEARTKFASEKIAEELDETQR